MFKHLLVAIFLFVLTEGVAQITQQHKTDSVKVARDSIKKAEFFKNLGNGYVPIGFFNLDLRYLIKFNQFEGFRPGLGGTTNDRFSKRYRINAYGAYGFRDKRYKFGIGGAVRISEVHNTWLNLSYTDDLTETGSSTFLTDKRFFTFIEPRRLNISLFHRHITKSIGLEHKLSNRLLSGVQFAVSNINPTYSYSYVLDDESFRNYDLSLARISLQWSPFSNYEYVNERIVETKNGYPKFTLQITQSFKDVLNGNFNFTKFDFRTIQEFQHQNEAITKVTLGAAMAIGDAPLTHLYHAYPNNINKETILQRFSVAGFNSFETMYFNEFFSDKFSTLQFKHFFKPFEFSQWFKPQLVLISRFAIGTMENTDRHQGIEFNTLEHIFSEAGFEINKLFYAFGLSFAYRYGAYHLPEFEDNFAFKFTFNLTL